MKYTPNLHHRRSIRLQGYDYSQAGAYFVIICARNRECLFGQIVGGEIQLNDAGRIVQQCWNEIPIHFLHVELDAFVVMPNHVHGIILIPGDRGSAGRGTACRASTVERFGCPVSGSMPTIVRSFKSAVTKRINEIRQTSGARIWQRNYWEHVIRNEQELNRIREYIRNNPVRWKLDRLHPDQPAWNGGGEGGNTPEL